MEPLTKDPEPAAALSDSVLDDDPPPLYVRSHSMSDAYKKLQDLHPYSLLLNIDDVDDVDWLEHAAFDSHEAASREKVRRCSYQVSRFLFENVFLNPSCT